MSTEEGSDVAFTVTNETFKCRMDDLPRNDSAPCLRDLLGEEVTIIPITNNNSPDDYVRFISP